VSKANPTPLRSSRLALVQLTIFRCPRSNGECGLFERVGRGRLPGQQARVGNQDLDEDVEIEEPGWMRALRYTCPTCGAKRTKVSSDASAIAS